MTIDQNALKAAIDVMGIKLGTFDATRFRDAITAYLAALPASDHAGLVERVAECAKEYAEVGFWRSCSGCHETEDGYDVGHYPHSKAFGCKLGSGCSECGGIGAAWDTTDYAAMGEDMSKPPAPQQDDIERLIDGMDRLDRYAPKIVPMGANPPLFDGMQPDNDGPWLSRVAVAKYLREAATALSASSPVQAPDEMELARRLSVQLLRWREVELTPAELLGPVRSALSNGPVLSDAPVVTEEMVERVFSAVIQCPHEIDHSSVILRVDVAKQGGARAQLHQRIAAALGGGE